MSITTLDPHTALVLIDLQKGIVDLPTAHPSSDVVARAAELAEAFRRRALPVVLVNVAGGAPGRTDPQPARPAPSSDWAELVPELDAQPQDIRSARDLGRLHRHRAGNRPARAGRDTGRAGWRRHQHRRRIDRAPGPRTGFNVTLVVDAMTELNEQAHDNSVARIFPRLGETGHTPDLLALLDKR